MAKILFYDLETTGVKPWRNGIHQIAGIVDIDGEVKEEFNLLVKPHPDADLNPEALAMAAHLKIDGLSPEEVLTTLPDMASVHKHLTDNILGKYVSRYDKQDKMFLCGYNNSQFDNQFFRFWFEQNGDPYFNAWFWINTLDVMTLSTQFFLKERAQMPDFKLVTVARRIGMAVDEEKLHDALYDIHLTRDLYYLLDIL
jgi:DNA polymerase-3 subunit epsilon